LAFTRLTEKLYRWLFLQPEWVHVLASDRHVRRLFAAAIADAVTKVPPYVSDPPPEPKRLNIRVGSGEATPEPSDPAAGSKLSDLTHQEFHESIFDPEGDVKAQFEDATEAYMDRLEAEQEAIEVQLAKTPRERITPDEDWPRDPVDIEGGPFDIGGEG
jgi:hypothetical protein